MRLPLTALRSALLLGLAGGALAGAGRAGAQSLDDASRAALEGSYVLKADRERQEGAEARVRGSIDNFMPSLSIVLDRPLVSSITYSPAALPSTVGLDAVPRAAPRQNTYVATLPLFDGFKRWNTLQSSWSLAEAGRHLTISRRQQVLLDTAAAYLAVLRDSRIVGFRAAQIAAATRVAASTARQFAVSDATRTDVALAHSRVQAAQAARDRAQADLAASRQEFKRLTGLDPARLAPPRVPKLGAATPEAFAALVRAGNPQLQAARLDADSADHLADAATSALLPSLDLQASRNDEYGYAPGLDRITDSTVRLIARFPLYEPGAYPRLSEARAAARQRGYEVQDSEQATLASARTSFERRAEVGAELARLRARVGELQATMRGYEIEREAGFRTVIDELNIQAELGDAQAAAAVVAAEYDGLTFTLAAAAGLLSDGPAGPAGPGAETAETARPVPALPAPGPGPGVSAPLRPLPSTGQTARSAAPPWPLRPRLSDEVPLSIGLRGTEPTLTAGH